MLSRSSSECSYNYTCCAKMLSMYIGLAMQSLLLQYIEKRTRGCSQFIESKVSIAPSNCSPSSASCSNKPLGKICSSSSSELLHLYRQVDEYPNFKEDLLRLRAEMTLEKEKMLKNTQDWFQTSLTVNKEEYMVKLRLVQLTFYNFFNSPLLLPPPSAITNSKQQFEQDNSSMLS